MAKLTKTQLNHVQARLYAMKEVKMTAIKDKLPDPDSFDVDATEVGLAWAAENPTKFVKMCQEDMKDKRSYNYLSSILAKTPPVKRAEAKVDMTRKQNDARVADADLKLTNEIIRIMDQLYFCDCDDAKAALAEFEKLNV